MHWWSWIVIVAVGGCAVESAGEDGAGTSSGTATTSGIESSGAASTSMADGSSGAESSGATESSGGTTIAAESGSGTTGADVGMCCFIDASCSDLTEVECTAADGHSWMAEDMCGIGCPDERQGACCYDFGCEDGVTIDFCGPNHAGPGTTCKSGVCDK